ncbi:MAG: sigma-70 family RNA polymerase sigma factor [Acidobacteria bacterium]|nr:sigma-70 family RNA polymerase sigma factor [Acidobacteriota bacterium]
MFRRRPADPVEAERFGAEVLQYLEPLFATALRLTRDRADAEDLVQDTMVKALRSRSTFEAGTNLRAWLYTILHNAWKNRLRSRSRSAEDVNSELVEEVSNEGLTGAPAATPEQVLLDASMDGDLQAALDEMPEAFRQAVWLRDVEDFTYAEIAGMLGVPIGTVMSRISRGRRWLMRRLQERSGPGMPLQAGRVRG